MSAPGPESFVPSAIRVLPTRFADVRLFEPSVFTDERGALEETYSHENYSRLGVRVEFVQDTVTWSRRLVLRGPHYDPLMAKFIQVLQGEVYDVVVDMRDGSPTFKQWEAFELSGANRRQLYIPAGFAHAFLALSDETIVHYKLSAKHDPDRERRIHWRDPSVGIVWPITEGVIVSGKDAAP